MTLPILQYVVIILTCIAAIFGVVKTYKHQTLKEKRIDRWIVASLLMLCILSLSLQYLTTSRDLADEIKRSDEYISIINKTDSVVRNQQIAIDSTISIINLQKELSNSQKELITSQNELNNSNKHILELQDQFGKNLVGDGISVPFIDFQTNGKGYRIAIANKDKTFIRNVSVSLRFVLYQVDDPTTAYDKKMRKILNNKKFTNLENLFKSPDTPSLKSILSDIFYPELTDSDIIDLQKSSNYRFNPTSFLEPNSSSIVLDHDTVVQVGDLNPYAYIKVLGYSNNLTDNIYKREYYLSVNWFGDRYTVQLTERRDSYGVWVKMFSRIVRFNRKTHLQNSVLYNFNYLDEAQWKMPEALWRQINTGLRVYTESRIDN